MENRFLDLHNRAIYNYRTEEYEHIDPSRITDYSQYIPQIAEAQNLYSLYVDDIGMTPRYAAFEVLKVCVNAISQLPAKQ